MITMAMKMMMIPTENTMITMNLIKIVLPFDLIAVMSEEMIPAGIRIL